jgi:hypothetical protein
MNNLRSITSAIVLGCALVVACFTQTGCQNPAKTAYVAAQTGTITVEAAMGLWDTYVQQKHPGVTAELKVKAAYEKYQAADIALLKAGRAMLGVQLSTATDADKASARLAWQEAEAALQATAADLYALLKSFGLKLP